MSRTSDFTPVALREQNTDNRAGFLCDLFFLYKHSWRYSECGERVSVLNIGQCRMINAFMQTQERQRGKVVMDKQLMDAFATLRRM